MTPPTKKSLAKDNIPREVHGAFLEQKLQEPQKEIWGVKHSGLEGLKMVIAKLEQRKPRSIGLEMVHQPLGIYPPFSNDESPEWDSVFLDPSKESGYFSYLAEYFSEQMNVIALEHPFLYAYFDALKEYRKILNLKNLNEPDSPIEKLQEAL
mgnify:FL=1